MLNSIHLKVSGKSSCIFLCAIPGAVCALPLLLSAAAQVLPSFSTFYVKSYAGRCLDFGPPPQVIGSAVFIYDCNGTIAQQVGIQELFPLETHAAARIVGTSVPQPLEPHAVILHAGTKCIGSSANPPIDGGILELEACSASSGQQFLLDGDSIMLAANRRLAVQLQNAHGAKRTPLVLGPRNLSDTEFWDFTATDGTAKKLTTGFISVLNENDLRNALQNTIPNTVIVVDGGASLDFKDLDGPLLIPDRVTIRGGRRGTNLGPQITLSPGHIGLALFKTAGNNVRITGLRLHGPGRARSHRDSC